MKYISLYTLLKSLLYHQQSHSQGQQILSTYVRYQCCCCNVAAAAAANAKHNNSENEHDGSCHVEQEYSERLDKYFRLR